MRKHQTFVNNRSIYQQKRVNQSKNISPYPSQIIQNKQYGLNKSYSHNNLSFQHNRIHNNQIYYPNAPIKSSQINQRYQLQSKNNSAISYQYPRAQINHSKIINFQVTNAPQQKNYNNPNLTHYATKKSIDVHKFKLISQQREEQIIKNQTKFLIKDNSDSQKSLPKLSSNLQLLTKNKTTFSIQSIHKIQSQIQIPLEQYKNPQEKILKKDVSIKNKGKRENKQIYGNLSPINDLVKRYPSTNNCNQIQNDSKVQGQTQTQIEFLKDNIQQTNQNEQKYQKNHQNISCKELEGTTEQNKYQSPNQKQDQDEMIEQKQKQSIQQLKQQIYQQSKKERKQQGQQNNIKVQLQVQSRIQQQKNFKEKTLEVFPIEVQSRIQLHGAFISPKNLNFSHQEAIKQKKQQPNKSIFCTLEKQKNSENHNSVEQVIGLTKELGLKNYSTNQIYKKLKLENMISYRDLSRILWQGLRRQQKQN